MIRNDRNPEPRQLGLAAIGAGLLSGIPLVLEVARAHKGMTTVERPDRVVGWSGDPLGLPLAALWLAAAIATVGFAILLVRQRQSAPSVAAAISLPLGASASLVMVVATVDPHMYASNPLRGLAAIVVSVAWPVAILLVAAATWRLSRAAAVASLGAAAVAADLGVTLADIAAANGSHQPSVDAALAVQAVAAAWLVCIGVLLALRVATRLELPARAGIAVRVVAAMAVVLLVGTQLLAVAPRTESLLPMVATELSGRTTAYTIDVSGIARAYRVHRPASPPANAPLVIVLHGSFGSGFQMEKNSGFGAEADLRRWIVAYPDGVLDGWDAFGSNDSWGRHPGADDLAFLSAMVARLETTDGVDPARIYVTGHSRGGMMTYRVACELPQPVAAIAPMSGNMATESGSADVPCNPGHPISVLATHGTADGVIPFAGGHVDITFAPFVDVVARWRAIDGCAGNPSTSVEGRDTFTTWSCASGTRVETWVEDGGCHCIPSGAAKRIFDFFEAHPLVRASGSGSGA